MSDSEFVENRGNLSPGKGEPESCHRSPSPIIKQEQRSPRPVADTQMGVRFTNFFIDEILKPHFGKNDREIPRALPTSLKSEFSLLSEKFSGLIHRPLPCLKQTLKAKTLEQSTALDLRRERVVKRDIPRSEAEHVTNRLPVIGTVPETNRESPRAAEDCVSPTPSQSSSPTPTDQDTKEKDKRNLLWPAWVYCTRYSDRPSSGPRSRRNRRKEKIVQEKRPRTAFSASQLERLKKEFENSRYLTESRRQDLARELNLNESQIKIWFQNKRAKLKKCTGLRNGLALHLMAQGLYNHSTSGQREDEEIDVEG